MDTKKIGEEKREAEEQLRADIVEITFTLYGKIKLWILKHVVKIDVLQLIFSDKQNVERYKKSGAERV